MKAPDPVFTSSTSDWVPSAIFFDMIDERDERDGLDGGGDVAQGVELAVGRSEVGTGGRR